MTPHLLTPPPIHGHHPHSRKTLHLKPGVPLPNVGLELAQPIARRLGPWGILTLLWGTPLAAQEAGDAAKPVTLTAEIHEFPPFVNDDQGVINGFDIDYWEAIAELMDAEFKYQSFETIQDLLEATRRGRVDVALGGITINQNRELTMDFSHGYYQSGLQVMVPFEHVNFGQSLIRALTSKAILFTLAVFAGFVVLAGFAY